jgi:uncharacterized protein (TIGR02001 family)
MRTISQDGLGRAERIVRVAAILAVACPVLLPRPAHADTSPHALLTLTSNYVYRGYSKSHGDPTLQGNVDYERSPGFFLGAWMSRVDFGDGRYRNRAYIEANPYVGVSLGFSERWRLDTVLAGYLYDGEVYGRGADYGELTALLHFRDLFTARVGVSYDAYGRGAPILDYELSLRYPVTDTVEVSGGLGYEDANRVLRYSRLYGSIGVGWFLSKHAALDLHYYAAHRFDEFKGEAASTAFAPPRIGHPMVLSISIGF